MQRPRHRAASQIDRCHAGRLRRQSWPRGWPLAHTTADDVGVVVTSESSLLRGRRRRQCDRSRSSAAADARSTHDADADEGLGLCLRRRPARWPRRGRLHHAPASTTAAVAPAHLPKPPPVAPSGRSESHAPQAAATRAQSMGSFASAGAKCDGHGGGMPGTPWLQEGREGRDESDGRRSPGCVEAIRRRRRRRRRRRCRRRRRPARTLVPAVATQQATARTAWRGCKRLLLHAVTHTCVAILRITAALERCPALDRPRRRPAWRSSKALLRSATDGGQTARPEPAAAGSRRKPRASGDRSARRAPRLSVYQCVEPACVLMPSTTPSSEKPRTHASSQGEACKHGQRAGAPVEPARTCHGARVTRLPVAVPAHYLWDQRRGGGPPRVRGGGGGGRGRSYPARTRTPVPCI